MANVILKKELRFIDVANDVYKFYDIEVVSVGYNQLQVIFHYGKAGTKGTTSVFSSNSFKEAMAKAYSKFHEKKVEGYEEREDLIGWLGQSPKFKKLANTKEKVSDKNKKSDKEKNDKEKKQYVCDLCHKPIKKALYEEINKWARGEGGWDKDPNHIGYKKVLCIRCQWEHEIFKKRF